MKTIRFLLLPALLFLGCFIAAGQNSSRYRITAFKKGDTTVISQSNVVEIMPPANLYVPNAFTPNGDGLNDVFGAKGDGIIEFSIQVFNRWGELVFEANDMNKLWDGTYNGLPAEAGVYVYSITAWGEKTNQISKSGTVTLIN